VHLVESGSAADKYSAGAIAGLAGVITEPRAGRLGICAAPGCERAFVDKASGRGKRYCSDQCTPKASVRTLRAGGRDRGPGPASTAAG